jgi:hypothetical protein
MRVELNQTDSSGYAVVQGLDRREGDAVVAADDQRGIALGQRAPHRLIGLLDRLLGVMVAQRNVAIIGDLDRRKIDHASVDIGQPAGLQPPAEHAHERLAQRVRPKAATGITQARGRVVGHTDIGVALGGWLGWP